MPAIDLTNARVTVMGLGRFGGGVGVTRWLVERGARVVVTDLETAEGLADSIERVRDLIDGGWVELRLGGHDLDDFRSADMVVANPAVPQPWKNEYLLAARDAGARVTTEIGLLIERIDRDRVIGVTGTAGKSTTAAMIHHILQKSGRHAQLGGNIGGSLLNQVDADCEAITVLELSSFMLYWLSAEAVVSVEDAGWSPRIAVLTNIDDNHLDWHGSREHYEWCKMQIARDQGEGDIFIDGRSIDAPREGIPLLVPGRHNQHNAALAILAAQCVGVSGADAAAALADFPGLPHRLELVAEADGRWMYNDSKSTTPQATQLAVRSFDDPSRVHLIAGGYDKGVDLTPIADVCHQIAALYTIGATGPGLARRAERRGVRATECGDVETAVEFALAAMQRGDVLLLSPGCASWDQFTNYERRGEVFRDCVRRWIGQTAGEEA